jgi:hypothetical protein
MIDSQLSSPLDTYLPSRERRRTGYGGCETSPSPGRDPLSRIAALEATQLRTVLDLRGSGAVGLAAY